MGRVLRIDHDGDLPNRYVQTVRNKLVFDNFQTTYPTHSHCDAVDGNANDNFVANILARNSIDFVSGAGHGEYESFIGKDGNAIWSVGQNFNFLSGKIVHLLSCRTGAILGRTIVQAGASVFLGLQCRVFNKY
jgi:hypothetical protein